MRPSVRPSVIHVVVLCFRDISSIILLTDFRRTFVTGASWDTYDLITFLSQKVKVQGHTIAAEAHFFRYYTVGIHDVGNRNTVRSAAKCQGIPWCWRVVARDLSNVLEFFRRPHSFSTSISTRVVQKPTYGRRLETTSQCPSSSLGVLSPVPSRAVPWSKIIYEDIQGRIQEFATGTKEGSGGRKSLVGPGAELE